MLHQDAEKRVQIFAFVKPLVLFDIVYLFAALGTCAHRFSYRNWNEMNLACTQEVREAIEKFRASANESLKSGDSEGDNGRRRRFTIAVADTFGEGTPVREGPCRFHVHYPGLRPMLATYLDPMLYRHRIWLRESWKLRHLRLGVPVGQVVG